MSKSWFPLLVILLVSCSKVEEATPVIQVETATPQPTSTPPASCSVISSEPTPAPDSKAYFPPVSQEDFSFGSPDAPVTILEYCDFQSPGCRNMAGVISTLMQKRDDVRFIFRPLPLIGILDKSEVSTLAALAADEQEKFWVMYDLLFIKYEAWVKLPPRDFVNWVIKESIAIGFNGDQLRADLNGIRTKTRLTEMHESARQIGIPAVPLLLINGVLQPSYLLDYRSIHDTVGLIALGEKQFAECPPLNVDPKRSYFATIQTEKGEILIELLPQKAPLTVNSFVFLAREGWFNGVPFHRVIPGFVAQSGDPSGTGRGNPGYLFQNEVSDLKFDRPGLVGMANSGPDTNGSQFFITFAPAPHLDGGYTLFGRVIRGLEIAEQLTPRDPDQSGNLPDPDRIQTVTIEEK
jgi:cyclophilin family peptidyl-prolyl cis-trans isomerase